jgi:hypothetical protein
MLRELDLSPCPKLKELLLIFLDFKFNLKYKAVAITNSINIKENGYK